MDSEYKLGINEETDERQVEVELARERESVWRDSRGKIK